MSLPYTGCQCRQQWTYITPDDGVLICDSFCCKSEEELVRVGSAAYYARRKSDVKRATPPHPLDPVAFAPRVWIDVFYAQYLWCQCAPGQTDLAGNNVRFGLTEGDEAAQFKQAASVEQNRTTEL